MKRGMWLLIWGLVVRPALLMAQGGPPMVTDDPGTVEPGHWEVNLAWTHEHRTGETNAELPLVDINYGLNDHAHLKYEVAWQRLSDAGSNQAGAGDSSVGVKWRFWDEDRHGLAASVYPQFSFRTATSSVRRGLSSGATTLLLPVQLQKGFGPFSVNADLGYARDSRSADAWLAGVAAGWDWRKWELMVELHGEREVGAAGTTLLLNAGFRRPLRPGTTLLCSLGREISNHTAACAAVFYLGVQLSR